MDYRLLGPLEASDGDTPVVFGGRKQRALLARLLLDANRTVPVDRLIDDLWGADVPDYGGQDGPDLRVAAPQGASCSRRSHATRPPGYVIEVEHDGSFRALPSSPSTEGRAALDAGDATHGLGAAEGRARALAGAPRWPSSPSRSRATERAHLEELHLVCIEDRIDADLALGRHANLVGELEALIARPPAA